MSDISIRKSLTISMKCQALMCAPEEGLEPPSRPSGITATLSRLGLPIEFIMNDFEND